MFLHPKWFILAIVVGLYLPVAIDATVLHIAVPTLSQELKASTSQLLWIIDIYPLLMAGLILVMGALGDKIGYRKLMLMGSIIFGIASVLAALSPTANFLIFSRAILALGASMIMPATLACLRHTFMDEKERNFALGMWVMAGGAGAAFGPIVLVVTGCILKYLPKQKFIHEKKLNILDALILITAILLVIYSLKAGLKEFDPQFILLGLIGIVLGFLFVKRQIKSDQPLFDLKLFTSKSVKYGFTISVVAMIALVGFELLISQKLQYVYQFSPLQAGLYILPFMIAVSVGGVISTPLLNKFGAKKVAVFSLILSSVSMYFLSVVNFETEYLFSAFCMILLGLSILCAFLAATSAILSGAPIEQASSAGAIEGMSYELGTGLGLTIFGLMASFFYTKNVDFHHVFSADQLKTAESSIGGTYQVLPNLSAENADLIMKSANSAFVMAHSSILIFSSLILLFLAIFIWIFWRETFTKSLPI